MNFEYVIQQLEKLLYSLHQSLKIKDDFNQLDLFETAKDDGIQDVKEKIAECEQAIKILRGK